MVAGGFFCDIRTHPRRASLVHDAVKGSGRPCHRRRSARWVPTRDRSPLAGGTPILTNPTPLGLSAWPTGVGGAEFGLAVEAGFVRPGVLG